MYSECINDGCRGAAKVEGQCGACYMRAYREERRKPKASIILAAYGMDKPLEKQYVYLKGKEVLNVEYYRNKYNISVGDNT